MAHPQKNNEDYKRIIQAFEDISSGKSVPRLESLVSKTYHLFLGGFKPREYPSSDYGTEVIKDMERYCELLSRRKRVNISGGEREITTEDEALRSLVFAEQLARNFGIPFLRERNDFLCKLFKDIHNLSISYVDSIVNGVADEYIPRDSAYHEKSIAVNLAKQGIRVFDSYSESGVSENTKLATKKFEIFLAETNPRSMRPFEVVATTPKHIHKGARLSRELEKEVTSCRDDGEFSFKPSLIFPIAHGGTELGLRLSNAYEELGHTPIVYPLMFSMKTRRQKSPWVENDAAFLGKSMEGKDILVTEDWVTTGNTLRGILFEIEKSFPHEVRVATIKRDPEKSKIPLIDKYLFYVGEWSRYLGSKTDSLQNIYNGKFNNLS